jgi:hypothetical protein
MYLIIGFAIVLGLIVVGMLSCPMLVMRYGRANAGSKSLSATMEAKMSLLNTLGAA